MSLDLRTYRTARTPKRCHAHLCRRPIERGDRYVRASLPPGGELGNTGWWSMNVCRECMGPEDRAAAGLPAETGGAR
ncbi:hypothetical protein [Streptomyces chumphonensis]|uniref:hypothetical protein n=1 Tax=Streptomyces chumphonensis TaxID=1214925 RepID=UPI003D71E60E